MRVAIDIETTVKSEYGASPYIDTIHCIAVNDGNSISLVYSPDDVENFLADKSVMKIFHNGAFDLQFLMYQINKDRLYDLTVENVWDTMIAERMLTAGTTDGCDLGAVVQRYTNNELDKTVRSTFAHHSGPLSDIQKHYAELDVKYLLDIQAAQQEEIDARKMTDIMRIENELVPIVAEMELLGIGFNPTAWEYILKQERALLPEIERKIQLVLSNSFTVDLFSGTVVGSINLNSPDQLMRALKRLGVQISDTQEATLEKIQHPVGQMILDYREHAKRLQWDYPKYVNPVTGRIHPTLVQTGADTGRFSCKQPNLQNVPHDQLFRDLFIPAPDRVFVVADYGQQELRVLAECSKDPNLVKVCQEQDPHLENAKIIFGDPTITKDDNRRKIAKGCSFALVYGGSPATLAHSAGVDLKEGKEVHRLLHKKYPGVDSWGTQSWEFLKTHGYIETLGGRRRYFPWVNEDPGRYMTVARNSPIQGSSADMMKLAMILVTKYIKPFGAKLVLCIHDEIVVESPRDCAEDVARAVERGMIEAGEYYVKVVPTIVEATVSDVWQK